MSTTANQFFTNQNLFSTNYLENRLPETSLWQDHQLEATQVFAAVKAAYKDTQGLKLGPGEEASLEDRFIRPILKTLGFAYDVQPVIQRTRKKRPDYALFASEAELREAHRDKANLKRFFSHALTIAEAKYWNRPLNDTVKEDALDSRDATAQLVRYLDDVWLATDGKILWGVLTNGKLWRLFYYRAASRSGNYYEVDLEEILRSGDADSFKYFYLFFARDAFVTDPQTGKTWLDQHLAGSETYAKVIGEKLKERIFDHVFERLAEGFLEYRRKERGIITEDESTLTDVFNGCLTLLYRLLFVLYAEARELLPVSDKHRYYRKSLRKLQHDVLDDLRRVSLDHMSHNAYDYWARIESLCRVIDKGDKALNVPTYNGGLFQSSAPDEDQSAEARAIRFIRDHKLADPFLAEAIEALTADNDPAEPGKRSFIDYSSLGVRHLGNIYEGLLEFHVRVATVEMAEVKEKGRVVWKSLSQVKNARHRRKNPGEVYIENSRNERRATGSYFTPHYIVEYIVKHAVGPVLEERLVRVRTLLEEYKALQKKAHLQKTRGTAQVVRSELLDKEKNIFDTLFSLKVLDPAMGSGHFLVRTVNFIADRIIAFLAEYLENPMIRRVEAMRAQILEDVTNRQGVEINKAKLTEVNLIKRMVMKRCIYGVDLNPMAVELAKLSLWLDSFTLGAPLSFLDHHLKGGNSLIGTTVAEVERGMSEEEFEGTQHLLFGSRFAGLLSATELMRAVGELTDTTFDEVKRSTSLYKEADEALAPFKMPLDFWVSEHFGAKGVRNFLTVGGDVAALLRSPEKLSSQAQKLLLRVEHLKAEKRFFHWALEFPEVFYDQTGTKAQPGFDAVIGNPPYVRSELADKEERRFLMESGRFQRLRGRFDLYLAFLEQGLELTTSNGHFGMIVPDAVLTINYGIAFREWILHNYSLLSILDLSSVHVFEDAAVAPSIMIICKDRGMSDLTTSIHKFNQTKMSTTVVLKIPQEQFLNLPQSAIRISLNTTVREIKPRIDTISIPCGQLCYTITGFVGHDSKTGASKDRLIHQTRINRHCKPYVEAKEWSGRYSFVEPTRYFEYVQKMHRPKFSELFERPKILIQRLASGGLIEATLDSNQIYVNHVFNCCVKLEDIVHLGEKRLHLHLNEVSPDERYRLSYILSLIASSLLGFYHRQFLSPALDIFPKTIRQLPIRRIDFITPEKERIQLLEKGKQLYERCLAKGDQACVLGFVEHALRQTPEQADVVHDLLAFLAEQMIEMSKAKQVEVKGFLGWLEREIGAKIDDLKNKTKLKAYHDGPFDDLLEVLKANHKSLTINPSRRGFQDGLEKEFSNSLAKLGPLKARIEATDRLIDQIVYRLYGLIEEEIRIVEGEGALGNP